MNRSALEQHGIVLFKNRSLRLSKPEVVQPYPTYKRDARKRDARQSWICCLRAIRQIRRWLRIGLDVHDATFFLQLASIIKG